MKSIQLYSTCTEVAVVQQQLKLRKCSVDRPTDIVVWYGGNAQQNNSCSLIAATLNLLERNAQKQQQQQIFAPFLLYLISYTPMVLFNLCRPKCIFVHTCNGPIMILLDGSSTLKTVINKIVIAGNR